MIIFQNNLAASLSFKVYLKKKFTLNFQKKKSFKAEKPF